MKKLIEREPSRIRNATAMLTGIGALVMVGCGPNEVDATTHDDREPPVIYQAEDGIAYTGEAAEEAWREENPSIPAEIHSESYMAELLIPREAMFRPMDTTDPSSLIDIFTHNMNCIVDAPHPKLQQLCVRATTGDELNRLGSDFVEIGENWFRRRLNNPDTESLNFPLEITDASAPIDRPIHNLDTISFVAIQTQNSEFGGEPTEVRLTFTRGSFNVDGAEVSSFNRFESGGLDTGEHRDVWLLADYTS